MPQDQYGHGTHVSGVIAAAGNNGLGVAGSAWTVQLVPLRALDRTRRRHSQQHRPGCTGCRQPPRGRDQPQPGAERAIDHRAERHRRRQQQRYRPGGSHRQQLAARPAACARELSGGLPGGDRRGCYDTLGGAGRLLQRRAGGGAGCAGRRGQRSRLQRQPGRRLRHAARHVHGHGPRLRRGRAAARLCAAMERGGRPRCPAQHGR